MKRRAFLTGSVVALLSTAPAVAAPHASHRRIGIIGTAPPTAVTNSFWNAFTTGLQEHGWVESRNLIIERRYISLGNDTAVAAAKDLVRSRVEVIVVASTLTALAAKEATRTVPIVMTVPSDPVAAGLVATLARPGGNVTGLSFLGTELAGKQVELLKEVVPTAAAIAILANATNASHALRTKEIMAAARALRLHAHAVESGSDRAVADALRLILKRGADALLVLADPLFVREMDRIVGFAAEHRLPVMYGLREGPLAGGLMSYGPSFSHLFRRAASYVDKILKGATPAELPIEQATQFELVINVRTAKALNVTIPPSVLLRADQVIE